MTINESQYNKQNMSETNMAMQDEQPWNVETSKRTSYMNRKGMTDREKEQKAEEIYLKLDEHMQKALALHEQLADYFCFLGLQGFKRKLEYQYMCEVAGKRKLHHKYVNMHHKLISMRQVEVPHLIPNEWSRYTTLDVNDNVLPKYVKSAMEQYKEWEEKTKQLYEDLWQECISYGMTADAGYISDLVSDVTKEIKKVNRMCEQLNGTGYDATAIHTMQDKFHEKYKKKYEDEYTDKTIRKMKKQSKTNE